MPVGAAISGVRTHLSRPMSPGDRGREFGRCNADAVKNTISFYRRLVQRDFGAGEADVRHWGEQAADAICHVRCGELGEEIAGLAHGAGEPVESLMVLNARTELLAGSRYAAGTGQPRLAIEPPRASCAECSVVGLPRARTRGGQCYLAQNWDFHPDLRASRVLWGIQRSDGRWICTLAEAGMLAKIGLNSSGLAMTINYLVTPDDGGLDGVPIHILARMVLDCGDLSSALRELATARVTASTAFNLAFSDEEDDTLISVEVTPSGSRVTHPTAEGILVHTNHFLDPAGLTDLVLGPQGWFGTLVRHQQLARRLTGQRTVEPEDIFRLLRSHHNAPESVCLHKAGQDWEWVDQGVTLVSLLMDVTARRLWLAGGNPCMESYEPFDVADWLRVADARDNSKSRHDVP